ncbi:hypothetical protein GCM10020219_048610 [Nonomuraea dietziae]
MRLVNFAPPDNYDWTPPGPASPRRTEPFAVVALILGLLTCFPVAIPFAAAALVRIRRSGDAGRAMAIAGLVMSLVFPLAGAGAVYGGIRLYESFATPEGHVAFDAAEVGDCVDGLDNADHYVPLVWCEAPHQGEFLGLVSAPDDEKADEACSALLERTTADENLSFLSFATDGGRAPCYMVNGVSGGRLVGSGASARPVRPEEEVLEGTLVHAAELLVGTCANEVLDGDKFVRFVACDKPHEGKLLATFALPKSPWPGKQEVARLAVQGCEDRTRDRAEGTLWTRYPSDADWVYDQRVACYDT